MDIQHFEICSELIDVLIDVSCIYGDIEHQSDESGCTTTKLKTGEATREDSSNTYPLPLDTRKRSNRSFSAGLANCLT